MKTGAAAVIVLLSASLASAQAESPDARGWIERAIAHHGGTAALRAYGDFEQRGTFESGRWSGGKRWDLLAYERADGAYRREVTFEIRGRKVTAYEMYDGGTVHKQKFGSGWDDLPLDQPREEAAHRLPFLLAALEREAKVDGEGQDADVDVVRVSVPDGRGRAVLSFAKDDGRLVALHYPGTEADGNAPKKDVERTLVFRDYRTVGALRLPFDVAVFSDGTLDTRYWLETMRPITTFDLDWIRVPDATERFIPEEEMVY